MDPASLPSGPFVLFATIQSEPSLADELEHYFRRLICVAETEPGTLNYTLIRDPNEPHMFYAFEEYQGREAFVIHTQSALYKELKQKNLVVKGSATISTKIAPLERGI